MHAILQECPLVIEVPVLWGEMDALQHVNNIVYFRYFENARMAYFEKLRALRVPANEGLKLLERVPDVPASTEDLLPGNRRKKNSSARL